MWVWRASPLFSSCWGGWLDLFPCGSLSSTDKGFGTGGDGWERITKEWMSENNREKCHESFKPLTFNTELLSSGNSHPTPSGEQVLKLPTGFGAPSSTQTMARSYDPSNAKHQPFFHPTIPSKSSLKDIVKLRIEQKVLSKTTVEQWQGSSLGLFWGNEC